MMRSGGHRSIVTSASKLLVDRLNAVNVKLDEKALPN
jgi:hypothetical protein